MHLTQAMLIICALYHICQISSGVSGFEGVCALRRDGSKLRSRCCPSEGTQSCRAAAAKRTLMCCVHQHQHPHPTHAAILVAPIDPVGPRPRRGDTQRGSRDTAKRPNNEPHNREAEAVQLETDRAWRQRTEKRQIRDPAHACPARLATPPSCHGGTLWQTTRAYRSRSPRQQPTCRATPRL